MTRAQNLSRIIRRPLLQSNESRLFRCSSCQSRKREHSLFLSMPRASGSEACRRRRVSGKLILPETRMFETIVPLGNQMPPSRLRTTQHVWELFIPDLLEGTRYKYVRRRRWCEGPSCMFIRTDGRVLIRPLSHTVFFRERSPQSSFLSFRLDKDAMDYALSMVQFLRKPDSHLVHTGKQWLNPGSQNS